MNKPNILKYTAILIADDDGDDILIFKEILDRNKNEIKIIIAGDTIRVHSI